MSPFNTYRKITLKLPLIIIKAYYNNFHVFFGMQYFLNTIFFETGFSFSTSIIFVITLRNYEIEL